MQNQGGQNYQEYQVIQLEEDVWIIEDAGVRCFLFIGEHEALLIDSGFGTGDLKAVVERLTNLPVMLVNTHADRDHIGCNFQFDFAHMHPAEYDRYQGVNLKTSTPPRPLWEGDIIDIGGRCFKVILIPGHTPGSIALLDENNHMLIGGDSVQTGSIYMFGPGRNLPAYIESMEKLRGICDKVVDRVYPSHGEYPVKPDIIEGLISGAKSILSGNAKGVETAARDITVMEYDVCVAKFLCAS